MAKDGTTSTLGNTYVITRTGWTFDPEISLLSGVVLANGQLVLRLNYDLNRHTVTYEYTGDVPAGAPALPKASTHYYNTAVELADTLSMKGYEFIGWRVPDGVRITVNASGKRIFRMLDQDIVITASWNAKTYDISFVIADEDTSKGTLVDNRPLTSGTFGEKVSYRDENNNPYVVVTPSDSSAWILAGWKWSQTDDDGVVTSGITVNPADITVGGTIVFTAVWGKVSSVAYLPGDHGDFSADVENKTYFETEVGSALPQYAGETDDSGNPRAKTGYEFVCWMWTDSSGAVHYSNTESLPLTVQEMLRFTAVWRGIENSFVIDLAGGALGSDQTSVDGTYRTDDKITLPGSSYANRPGYHAAGFSKNPPSGTYQKDYDLDSVFIMPAEGVTLYIYWEEDDPVRIVYVAGDGGNVEPTVDWVAPKTGIPQGSTATPKKGYHFIHWIDAKGNEVSLDKTFIPTLADGAVWVNGTTFTAVFAEDDPVTITYEINIKGAGTLSLTSESIAPATGRPKGSTATANKGFKFLGWYDTKGNIMTFVDENGDTLSYNEQMPSFVPPFIDGAYEMATYIAMFEGGDTDYVVEYWLLDLDGKPASVVREQHTGKAGDSVAAEVKDIQGYVYHAGYTYTDGTIEIATGTIAGDGSLVLKLFYDPGNVNINYVLDASRKETWKAGSDTFSGSKRVTSETTMPGATDVSRPGYTLVGWNTNKDAAEAGTVEYPLDLSASPWKLLIPTFDLTFYPVWLANTDTPYTVEHWLVDSKGNASRVDSDTESHTGTTDTTANATKKTYTGYKYVDSYTNAANETVQSILSGNINGDGSLVLKLFYQVLARTINYDPNGGVWGGDKTAPVDTAYANETLKLPQEGSDQGQVSRPGYNLVGFSDGISRDKDGNLIVFSGDIALPAYDGDVITFTAVWQARNDTKYTVRHYRVRADGTTVIVEPLLAEDILKGTTDSVATAMPKDLAGFSYAQGFKSGTWQEIITGVIAGDGSLVLKLFYLDRTDTVYKIEHYKVARDGSSRLADTDTLQGETLTEVSAAAYHKHYAGYQYVESYDGSAASVSSIESGTIAADGSLVLMLYYLADNDVPYVVEHWMVTADGKVFDTPEKITRYIGETDQVVSAADKIESFKNRQYIAGFDDHIGHSEIMTGTVAADGSLVLRLYYRVSTITIVFDPNGGAWTSSDLSGEYGIGLTSTLPSGEAVHRNGYTLKGWSENPDAKTPDYDAGASWIVPNTPTTLYAIWTPDARELRFDANDSTDYPVKDINAVPSVMGVTDGEVTIPSTVYYRPGWKFISWNTKADGSGQTYRVGDTYLMSADLTGESTNTLFALWEQIIYTVEYYGTYDDPNGPQPPSKPTKVTGVMFSKSLGLNDIVEVLDPYIRRGYTFNGWLYNDTPLTAAISLREFLGDTSLEGTVIRFTADWRVKYYTVVYYKDEKVKDTSLIFAWDQSAFSEQEGTGGKATSISERSLSKKGYSFMGWTNTLGSDGMKLTLSTIYADLVGYDDTVLTVNVYADFSALVYKINYDTRGGKLSGNPYNTFTWNQKNLIPEDPTWDKTHEFVGWYSRLNSKGLPTGAKVTASKSMAALAGSKPDVLEWTLYAKWKEIAIPAVITFDEGVKSSERDSVTGMPETMNTSLNKKVTLAAPSRTGYVFKGWSTRKNKAEYIVASPETSMVYTVTSTRVKLYAIWEKAQTLRTVQPVSFASLSVVTSDGSLDTENTQVVASAALTASSNTASHTQTKTNSGSTSDIAQTLMQTASEGITCALSATDSPLEVSGIKRTA